MGSQPFPSSSSMQIYINSIQIFYWIKCINLIIQYCKFIYKYQEIVVHFTVLNLICLCRKKKKWMPRYTFVGE
jgi:hypothetical protein